MVSLKICHILSADVWAGAEAQALSLIESLHRDGSVHITVVAFNRGIFLSRIREGGIDVHLVDESSRNWLSMLCQIVTILRKGKYDVIHVHGFKENFIGGLAAKLCTGARVVRTHHGRGMVGSGLIINHLIELFNQKYLTHSLIAVSHDLKRYLIDHHFTARKVTVIHNGVQLPCSGSRVSRDVIRKRLNVEGDSIVLGSTGRMVEAKGYIHLIECMGELVRSGNRVHCVLVGAGPLLKHLKSETKRMNVDHCVSFPGFRTDVQDFLEIFDIFVLPSLHEGIPLALLEAMNSAKAVVATEVGGVPEIIEDGKDGLLVPPGDSAAICNACTRLIRDRELRVRLGQNARERVRRDYMLEETVKRTGDIYRR
jgi:glycosyltransferase involved in cell wall biosynthesis